MADIDYADQCAVPHCGFDWGKCMDHAATGAVHNQTVDVPGEPVGGGYNFQYQLAVACDAIADVGGASDPWPWVEFPNEPGNDPFEFCFSVPEDQSPALEVDSYDSDSNAGATSAEVTWVYLGQPGDGETTDVTASVNYTIAPCDSGGGECVALGGMSATMPDTQVLGFDVSNIHLVVDQVTTRPRIERGRFSFGVGEIRVMLNFRANGANHAVASYNVDSATGTISGDALMFSGLRFNFGNSVVSADLDLRIAALLTESPPVASIAVFDAPTDCLLPVLFESRSSDPEGHPIAQNIWMSPSADEVEGGDYFALTLDNGETAQIALLSQDLRGRTGSATLLYRRACN